MHLTPGQGATPAQGATGHPEKGRDLLRRGHRCFCVRTGLPPFLRIDQMAYLEQVCLKLIAPPLNV